MSETTTVGGNLLSQAESLAATRRRSDAARLAEILQRVEAPQPGDAEESVELVGRLGLTVADLRGLAAVFGLIGHYRRYLDYVAANQIDRAEVRQAINTAAQKRDAEIERIRTKAEEVIAPLQKQLARDNNFCNQAGACRRHLSRLDPVVQLLAAGDVAAVRELAQRTQSEAAEHFAMD